MINPEFVLTEADIQAMLEATQRLLDRVRSGEEVEFVE